MRYTALDVAFRYADKKQKHAYVGCCVHVCAMYDVSLPGIMCVWRIVFCLSLSLSLCIFNRHSTVTYRNCIESQMKEYDSRRGCVGAAVATAVGDDDNVCARFCIYLHFSFLLYWRRQWWRIGRIHTCLTTLFSFIPWRSIFELTEPPLFNYGLYFVIVANCILLGLMIITSSCWRLSSMIVQRVQRVLCVHRYAFARTSYVQKYITRVYLCSYAKVSFCVRVESLNRAWTLFVCLAIRRLQNTLEYCYNSSWVLHFWTITVTVSIKG